MEILSLKKPMQTIGIPHTSYYNCAWCCSVAFKTYRVVQRNGDKSTMRSLTSLFFSTAYSITIIVIASLTRQSLLVISLINLSQMFFFVFFSVGKTLDLFLLWEEKNIWNYKEHVLFEESEKKTKQNKISIHQGLEKGKNIRQKSLRQDAHGKAQIPVCILRLIYWYKSSSPLLSDVFLWRVQWASAVWIFGMVHLERISTGNTQKSLI